jgi:hypothetical protein
MSLALARAEQQIADMFAESRARKAMIDADPRIVCLRAMRSALGVSDSSDALFRRLADGTVARSARITRLIFARMAQLDHFPHVARQHLRDAAITRRQHWSMAPADAGKELEAAHG